MSLRVSKVSERTGEQCERTRKRTSEWPSTQICILGYSGPQCSLRLSVFQTRVPIPTSFLLLFPPFIQISFLSSQGILSWKVPHKHIPSEAIRLFFLVSFRLLPGNFESGPSCPPFMHDYGSQNSFFFFWWRIFSARFDPADVRDQTMTLTAA